MLARKHWAALGAVALLMLHEEFARKLDRNLLRPLRNYHTTLSDHSSFRMQEDLARCLRELAEGIGRMGVVERDAEGYI